jgi:ABC-type nitrate/sulfonate/bicarbonate transport system permease component
MKKAYEFLIQNSPIFALIICWEVVSQSSSWDLFYFPAPSTIIKQFFYLLLTSDNSLKLDVLVSLRRLFFSAILSISLAVITLVLISLSKTFEKVLTPILAATYPIPKIAVLPFFLIIFGIGDLSKVAMISLGMYYLILMNSISGIERLKMNNLLLLAGTFKITGKNLYADIILRGIFPEFLQGVKTALGHGLILVVASEFSLSNKGIGFYIWNSWDQFRIVDIYVGLLILSFIGHFLFSSIDYLRNRLPEKIYPVNH